MGCYGSQMPWVQRPHFKTSGLSRRKCVLLLFWWVLLLFSHSGVSDSVTPWPAAHQASLSITVSQSLLKLMSTELVMPSNHLILCRPLFLPPSIFPSIRVFSNELVLHIRWLKYWSFNFSISPSNEYSGSQKILMEWEVVGVLTIFENRKYIVTTHDITYWLMTSTLLSQRPRIINNNNS